MLFIKNVNTFMAPLIDMSLTLYLPSSTNTHSNILTMHKGHIYTHYL